jgi:hypothetical protein
LLNPDFIDILSAFSEENVEFMVVGGYAMAFHGYVRGTGDIDLWVSISEENVARIWRALRSLGAPLRDLTIDDLKQPGMVFQMGLPPYRIDILNKIEGAVCEDAWVTRTFVEIDDLQVPVIGRSEPLRNKKAMNRPKDMADILWLENN